MESENIIKRSQSIINQKSCKYIPDVSIIVPISLLSNKKGQFDL